LTRILKAAGIAGIATPFTAFSCILAAIALWPHFNWTSNALSDLGVQWGLTATLFDGGLVVSGLLCMVFALGLWFFSSTKLLGKLATCLFFLACVAIVAIGVFNETFSPTHYVVSVMLFVMMPVSLLVFVGAFWLEGKHKLSVFTLATGLAAAFPWLLQFTIHYVSNVAIPEFVSVLVVAPWAIELGILMLKSA